MGWWARVDTCKRRCPMHIRAANNLASVQATMGDMARSARCACVCVNAVTVAARQRVKSQDPEKKGWEERTHAGCPGIPAAGITASLSGRLVPLGIKTQRCNPPISCKEVLIYTKPAHRLPIFSSVQAATAVGIHATCATCTGTALYMEGTHP